MISLKLMTLVVDTEYFIKMKRFRLLRYIDPHGVSGKGIVAEGVEFSDGMVALRWLGETASTNIYNSIDELETIHDHKNTDLPSGTRVVWIDK